MPDWVKNRTEHNQQNKTINNDKSINIEHNMPGFKMWLVCGVRTAQIAGRLYEPGVCEGWAAQPHDPGHPLAHPALVVEAGGGHGIVHGHGLVGQHGCGRSTRSEAHTLHWLHCYLSYDRCFDNANVLVKLPVQLLAISKSNISS